MKTQYAGLVTDEAAFMREHLPLQGARVAELGCGRADLARKLLREHGVAEVIGFEVDARQHAANLAAQPVQGLRFVARGAQDTGLPTGSVDGVMMLKSLHHVPVELLDQAMDEVGRVLRPGGWFYISEPVYAGEFNDIVKLFHDEGEVRACAYAAIQRAPARGKLAWEKQYVFDAPLHFRDFEDFVNKIVRVTHSDMAFFQGEVEREVCERFSRHIGATGAHFVRQMRIDLMRAL